MSARLLLAALTSAMALALASPARACPEPAATGTQPCDDVLRPAMINAGSGNLGASGWPIHQMHVRLNPSSLAAGWVPCVILSAVATTESSWHQFGYVACGQSAPTVVSADCGYGIGQITSGMDGSGGFSASKVAADPIYNLSVSVNILISKWEYTAAVNPNDPKIAEDWYFALWGYNGLAASNNPNTHPETLGAYYNPTAPAYSRSHYAYQEIVYGYALYPSNGTDSKPRWPSTKITHPDFAQICASCGNPGSSLVVSRPSPEHSGDCAATGPDWAAQYVSQSFPLASQGAVSLHPGETAAAWLEMKNVGQKSWDASTRLATTEPRDRASLFVGSDWLSPSRLANVTGTVAPGGTYKFQFTFHAPDAPGTYAEYLGMVQESVAWFSDPGQGGPPDNQLQAKLVVLPADVPDAGPVPVPPDAATPVEPGDGSTSSATDSGAPAMKADGGLDPNAHVAAGCGCAVGAGPEAFFLVPLTLLWRRRRR